MSLTLQRLNQIVKPDGPFGLPRRETIGVRAEIFLQVAVGDHRQDSSEVERLHESFRIFDGVLDFQAVQAGPTVPLHHMLFIAVRLAGIVQRGPVAESDGVAAI